MDAWIVWLIVAVVLAGAEAASAGLLLIMFSGGALAASLAAFLGAGAVGSAAVFALVSVALIAFVRPIAKRHVYQAPLERTGTAALIGTQAVVLETVDADNGRIKLGRARSGQRAPSTRARGSSRARRSSVFEIDGATAVVG